MPIPNDPLQPLQWYIDRSVRQDASVDLNVLPVWADYSGAGVHVGIFDELIESAHPDLVENYDSSLEIAGLTYDVSSGNGHGTAVAGIIGASANGDGVAGIAYDASITSAPVIYNTSVSFSAFVTAMSAADRFDVVNMSFGSSAAFDGGAITQAQWVPVAASYEQASAQGRNGLGTIFVAAAGNYRTDATNSGLSHYQAERHTIVVGAVGADGNIASYSSEGANLLVVAPSSSSLYYPDVTTTDQTGVDGYNSGNNPPLDPVPVDYTIRFGGTSAASPMVSGVVALMLEANAGPRLARRPRHPRHLRAPHRPGHRSQPPLSRAVQLAGQRRHQHQRWRVSLLQRLRLRFGRRTGRGAPCRDMAGTAYFGQRAAARRFDQWARDGIDG